jgi:hypothetical protein
MDIVERRCVVTSVTMVAAPMVAAATCPEG